MKQNAVTALAAIVGIAVGVAWSKTSVADDRTLPQAVQDALKREFPQGTFGPGEREHEGITVYELDVKNGNEELEVTVATDGTIVEVVRRVGRDTLPENVARALTQAAGKGTVGAIERAEVRAEPRFVALPQPEVSYEAEVQVDGKKHELTIDQTGKVEDDDDGDDDDDDDD